MEMIVRRSCNNSKIPKVYALCCHFYISLTAHGYCGVRSWIQVDLFSYNNNIMLIPIHLSGHWSLIAIHMDKKTIVYYDSLKSGGIEILYTIWQFLVDATANKQKIDLGDDAWTYHGEEKIPSKTSGFDCGVFTFQYAEYISREAFFTIN